MEPTDDGIMRARGVSAVLLRATRMMLLEPGSSHIGLYHQAPLKSLHLRILMSMTNVNIRLPLRLPRMFTSLARCTLHHSSVISNLKPLPPWTGLDERRAERWPMDVDATIRTSLHPTPLDVRIRDISTHGCLLSVAGGLILGRYVTLTLAPLVAIGGWIAWSRDDHAGVEVEHPLPAPMIERIIGAQRTVE